MPEINVTRDRKEGKMDISILYKDSDLASKIDFYARLVNAEVDGYIRLQAHGRVQCRLEELTDMDWKDFKPFESIDITIIPSVLRCKRIIWDGIRKYIDNAE